MYCLPFGLGKKLAKVEMLYDDDVKTLTKLDKNGHMSGGHLKAQLRRYDRLWRASLFASQEARRQLKSGSLLGAVTVAFKRGVLGLIDEDMTMYDLAKVVLASTGITYVQGAKIHPNLTTVERGSDSAQHYPSGQPTIRSHFFMEAS